MKLEIRTEIRPINVFGLEPEPIFPDKEYRQVFMDGKRLPLELEKIFLLGMDVSTSQYCNLIEKCMKEDGLQ
jgi:hypothetical protein